MSSLTLISGDRLIRSLDFLSTSIFRLTRVIKHLFLERETSIPAEETKGAGTPHTI
jgi:hypothetical protein